MRSDNPFTHDTFDLPRISSVFVVVLERHTDDIEYYNEDLSDIALDTMSLIAGKCPGKKIDITVP